MTSKSFEAWPNSNLLILHLDINIYHLDIGAMNTFNEPVWYQVLRLKAHFQVMGQCDTIVFFVLFTEPHPLILHGQY